MRAEYLPQATDRELGCSFAHVTSPAAVYDWAVYGKQLLLMPAFGQCEGPDNQPRLLTGVGPRRRREKPPIVLCGVPLTEARPPQTARE